MYHLQLKYQLLYCRKPSSKLPNPLLSNVAKKTVRRGRPHTSIVPTNFCCTICNCRQIERHGWGKNWSIETVKRCGSRGRKQGAEAMFFSTFPHLFLLLIQQKLLIAHRMDNRLSFSKTVYTALAKSILPSSLVYSNTHIPLPYEVQDCVLLRV